MSPIQIGFTSGIIYDVEQSIHQSPEGAGEAKLKFKCPWVSILGLLPAPLTPHPNFSSLLMYECEATREHGDIAVVTAIYRGVLLSNPSVYAQQEFQLSSTSEPIESHPKFSYPPENPPVTAKQIGLIQKSLDDPNVALDSSITGEALLLYNKKRRGIDSYLRVGGLFRNSYINTTTPSDYSKVGFIATSTPTGAPTPPTGQNYIFTGFSWRKSGGVVSVTEDYQLSGMGGWDTDLYTYTAP